MGGSRGRLVYSTGPRGSRSRTACAHCGTEPCSCAAVRAERPQGQQVRVRRERSGRRGKTVTVAGPLRLQRDQARANKDFSTADAIRDQLTEMGVTLEDTPQGTRWRMG